MESLILRSDVDLNVENKNGEKPIDIAQREGLDEVIWMLENSSEIHRIHAESKPRPALLIWLGMCLKKWYYFSETSKLIAKAIQENFNDIIHNIAPEDVLNFLFQEQAISIVERERIEAEHAGDIDKVIAPLTTAIYKEKNFIS